jgi:hypothetical protein
MTTLLLKFGISLEDYELEPYSRLYDKRHSGPLFHRWLPDGEKDAIELNTKDPNANLRVWFERRGFVENGYIKFDWDRKEANPDIISKQGILDAGPLVGKLEIFNLSEEDITPVKENNVGDPKYVAIGKRSLKLIYPAVSKFINILRTNYGQYWIRELKEWDSRELSLGHYFSVIIQTKWSIDSGKTWCDFVPNKREHGPIRLMIRHPNYNEYLSQKDWDDISKIFQTEYEVSLAAQVLSRAYKLLNQGHEKQALVEGVTALEIAINEFIRRKLNTNENLLKNMQSFLTLPLRAQVIALGVIEGRNTIQDLENAIRATDLRNRVVHEGFVPPTSIRAEILKLLEIIASLLPQPNFKFPNYFIRINELKTDKEWDEITSSSTSKVVKIRQAS